MFSHTKINVIFIRIFKIIEVTFIFMSTFLLVLHFKIIYQKQNVLHIISYI
jgi:hypothetical protein